MIVLRLGSIGSEVQSWQNFLFGQGYYSGIADGKYGSKTQQSTVAFQRSVGVLPATGELDRTTWAKAIEKGFGDVHDAGNESGPGWPPRSDLVSPSQGVRERMFGRFKYRAAPTQDNPEHIEILDDWAAKNLAMFEVPQLRGIKGAPADCKVLFHNKVGPRVQKLFLEWEKFSLLDVILTWNGSYAARFTRGSVTVLSAHAHGSAFDINVKWNPLGAEPPLVDAEGSVRELVPSAGQSGWFWGGFYKSRKDGMHFELAKLM